MTGPVHARPARNPGGFTLVELAMVLAITAILTAMALPGLGALVARQRLHAAAENLRADIALARQEAGRRAQPVLLAFQPGSPWCYAIATAPGADCRSALPRAGSGLIKVVRGSDQPGVQLLQASSMVLDSRTGASLAGSAGMARFASSEGQQLQVRLGAMGRGSICAPADPVAGTPACARADAGALVMQ